MTISSFAPLSVFWGEIFYLFCEKHKLTVKKSHAEDLAATKFPKSSLFSSTSVLNDPFGVRLTLQSTSKGLHLVFPASSVVLIQVIEERTSVL